MHEMHDILQVHTLVQAVESTETIILRCHTHFSHSSAMSGISSVGTSHATSILTYVYA